MLRSGASGRDTPAKRRRSIIDLFLRVRVLGGGGGSICFVVVGDRWEGSESLSVANVAVVDQHISSCCSGKQGVRGVWGGLVEFMTVQTVGTARGIVC